ncbi:MAG: hypothetical protein ACRCT8_07410 [Lacipirellulaceae bacterium]
MAAPLAKPPTTISWRAALAAPRATVARLESRQVLDATGLAPGGVLDSETLYAAPESIEAPRAAAAVADAGPVALDWSVVHAEESPAALDAAALGAASTPTIGSLSTLGAFEGSAVQLGGEVVGSSIGDPLTLTIDWGDGTVESFAIEDGPFAYAHVYADDNPTGTTSDTVSINLTLRGSGGEYDSQSASVRVTNAPPALGDVTITPVIDETGLATLTGSIADSGVEDTLSLTIDWGDGSAPQIVSLPAGTETFSLTHRYLDDNPTGTVSDIVTVSVAVADDDGGLEVERSSLTVRNVTPTLGEIAISEVDDDGLTTLTGAFTDPSPLDTFALVVDWGDGSPATVIRLEEGRTSFQLTHTYPTDGDAEFNVTVFMVDDDGGRTEPVSLVAILRNYPPVLSDLAVTSIDENGVATLTGVIADRNPRDTFTLTIDWGDGSPAQVLNLPAGTTTFSATHHYADDNPTGTPLDDYTVGVAVADDDGGATSGTALATVRNVSPTLGSVPTQRLVEGQAFTLAGLLGPGALPFGDVGLDDTHTATIDWGDGSPVESLVVSFSGGVGSLSGGHTYADNGLYTARITLTDDDAGVAVGTVLFRVLNVDPVLTGTKGPSVNEGAPITLAGLGVGVSDPGFDNPLNTGDPANGGEVDEVFLDGVIDWGDGSAVSPVSFVRPGAQSTSSPTTATPVHAPHHYADNGVYTVRVTLADDDGAAVTREFLVTVNNVAPTLTLNDPRATIDEGQTLALPMLGTFTDPGFDNPANQAGASVERFTYTINWGDGTVETLRSPSSLSNGSAGVLTSGTLAASHRYADNDADNRYTVTVTLSDDDGGSVERSFEVTVQNVAPTLEPISATDLAGDGVTTLTLAFSDPGADSFEVLVDWGDKRNLPAEQRFVVERLHAGPTPQTFVLQHRYTGPPDPLNPSADIRITVKVRDDDFGSAATVIGESNPESVEIDNPGIDENKVAIDTTPQAPPVEFPAPPVVLRGVERSADSSSDLRPTDLGSAGGDLSAASERFLELRVVGPDGVEGDGYRLKETALDDLPGLFARLPDGRYRVYVVQTETDTRRLVIDVTVRGGRLIDPSDDSDGGRDRPPTADEAPAPAIEQPTPTPATPTQAATTPLRGDEPADESGAQVAAAALLLAASAPAGRGPRPGEPGWREALARALERGPSDRLRRIRRRKPR